jgi:hypothetical protein
MPTPARPGAGLVQVTDMGITNDEDGMKVVAVAFETATPVPRLAEALTRLGASARVCNAEVRYCCDSKDCTGLPSSDDDHLHCIIAMAVVVPAEVIVP